MNPRRESGPFLILAFDAADARLIERWAAEGHLPTIKGLLERGVQSRLVGSEMVSENGIWISLFSGLSRAQHGYYYWRPLRPRTYELELSDQRTGAIPFWGHLRDTDARVAVIDPPETHCIPGLQGVQLANWAPHNARFKGYSIPESFFPDLCRRFGAPLGVEEHVGGTLDDDLRIHRGLLSQIEQKAAICRHLLAEGRFDLMVVGFHESHIAGHQFWKYSDRSHAPVDSGGRLTQATRDVYHAIDSVLGDLLARLPRGTTAIVLSNMGVQEDYPNLELTMEFCRRLGYHRVDPRRHPWSPLARLARRVIPQDWQRAISNRLPDHLHGQMLSREWLGGTDWSATTVFPIPAYYLGHLRVNLRGREPHGIIEPGAEYVRLLDQVEADLKCLTDPVSGAPAVHHVARTVDLFGAAPPESLPDVFFDWAPTPYPKRQIHHPRAVLTQKDMFFTRDTRHHLRGFLAAAGPGIVPRGRIADLSVLDVAPTCLHLMGLPVPRSMSGAVARAALA
jgi:predicted AlkP superfamily phosphohydrolase/phosphomutase